MIAGLSPQKTGFNPRSVHVSFMVDKVALVRFPFRVFRVSSVSIIPPMLHIYTSITDTIKNLATYYFLDNKLLKYVLSYCSEIDMHLLS